MDQRKLRQWLVGISFIATIVINALANIIPFNGQTTGAISDSFSVYFIPAGYVFSIWSVIYLLLGAYVLYQFLPQQTNSTLLDRIGLYFIGTSVANSVWIVLWHYNMILLSLLVMVCLLGLLIKIYQMNKHATILSKKRQNQLFVQLPFSVYLGWISVATIANVSVALVANNWGGWGIAPEVWTAVMIIVVTGLTGIMLLKENDYAYYVVIVWAFLGILIKHPSVQIIAVTIIIGLTVLSLLSGVTYYRHTLHKN